MPTVLHSELRIPIPSSIEFNYESEKPKFETEHGTSNEIEDKHVVLEIVSESNESQFNYEKVDRQIITDENRSKAKKENKNATKVFATKFVNECFLFRCNQKWDDHYSWF